MIVGVIIVVGAIAAWKYRTMVAEGAMAATQKPQPTMISAAKATIEEWQDSVHAIGSLAPVQGVMIINELDGTITKLAFESGALVKQGDILLQQDVSTEQAQLANAEAIADFARLSLQRAKDLRTLDTNAQIDLDAADSQARQAAATAEMYRSVIVKKTIRAPFAGRLGIRQVNAGQYLRGGSTIVALLALDPIYVNFSLKQQEIPNLTVGQTVLLTIDAFPGRKISGIISALHNQVDDATRNLQVQATVANPGETLKPGMFASVDVLLPQKGQFITLSQTAIVYNPYGNAVYVIEKSTDAASGDALIARQRFVQLGKTRGDQVAILKGLKAGEDVVTSGQIKLRNGSIVAIDNSLAPASSATPTVPNN
jgi:membrane fusion protein (multidrug efflux system)